MGPSVQGMAPWCTGAGDDPSEALPFADPSRALLLFQAPHWECSLQGSSSPMTLCRARSGRWETLSPSSELWESRPLPTPTPPTQPASPRTLPSGCLWLDRFPERCRQGPGASLCLRPPDSGVPLQTPCLASGGEREQGTPPLPAFPAPPDRQKPSPPLFSLIIVPPPPAGGDTLEVTNLASLRKSPRHGAAPFVER